MLRPVLAAVVGLLVCFGAGAAISTLLGISVEIWLPAGLITCAIVAIFAGRALV